MNLCLPIVSISSLLCCSLRVLTLGQYDVCDLGIQTLAVKWDSFLHRVYIRAPSLSISIREEPEGYYIAQVIPSEICLSSFTNLWFHQGNSECLTPAQEVHCLASSIGSRKVQEWFQPLDNADFWALVQSTTIEKWCRRYP